MNNPFWQQFQGQCQGQQQQQQPQQQPFGNIGFNFGQMPMSMQQQPGNQTNNSTTNDGGGNTGTAQNQTNLQQQQQQQQLQLQQQQLAFMAGMGNMGFGGNAFGASFAGAAGVGGNMPQLQQQPQQQQSTAAGSTGAGGSNNISALSSMTSFFGSGGGGGGGMSLGDTGTNANANNAMMPSAVGGGFGGAGNYSAAPPPFTAPANNNTFPSMNGTGMFGGTGGSNAMGDSSGTGQNTAAASMMNAFAPGTAASDQGMNNALNMNMNVFGQATAATPSSSGASAMPPSDQQLPMEQQLQQLLQSGSSTNQGTAVATTDKTNMPTDNSMGGLLNGNNLFTGSQQQQQQQNQNLSQTLAFGGTGMTMGSPPPPHQQPQRKKEKQQQQKPFFPTTASTSGNATAPTSVTGGAGADVSVPLSQTGGGTDWYAQMQQLLAQQHMQKQQQQQKAQAQPPAVPPPVPAPLTAEGAKPNTQEVDLRGGWLASLKANQGAALDSLAQQPQPQPQPQQQMNSGNMNSFRMNSTDGTNLTGAIASPAVQVGATVADMMKPGVAFPASMPDQSTDLMSASNATGPQQGAGSASAVSASVMQAMMAAAAAAHPNSTAAAPTSAMPTSWASMLGQQLMMSGIAPANSQHGGTQSSQTDQELRKLLKVGKPGGVSEEVAKAIFSTRNMSAGAVVGQVDRGTNSTISAGGAGGVTMKSQKKKRGRPPKKSSFPSQASNTTNISTPSTSVPVPTTAKPPVLSRQQKHRLLVQKVLQANPSLVLAASPPPVESLSGADHLIASTVPSSFPPDLVLRALSSYATLRTLSTQLKISPFTPQAFLRALALPVPTKLLGEVHSQLLHLLFELRGLGLYTARGDGIRASNNRGDCNGVRRITAHEHAGENLANLDGWTWPLFYDDYFTIVEDEFSDSVNSEHSMVDMRSHCMQSIRGLKEMGFISESSDFRYEVPMDESGAFLPSANAVVSPTPPPDVAMHGARGGAVDVASGRGARRKARPQASMDESDTSSHSSASSGPESDEESSEDEYKPFWRGGGRGRGRAGVGRGRGAGRGVGKKGRPPKHQGVVVAGVEPVPKRPRGRPRKDEASGNGRSSSSIGSKVEDVTFISTKKSTHETSVPPILGGRDPFKVTSSGRPACQVEGCTKTSQGKKYGYMCVSHFRVVPAEELASMLDAMESKPVERTIATTDADDAEQQMQEPATAPLSDHQTPLPILNPVFALPPDTTMSARAHVVPDEVYDNIQRALSRKTSKEASTASDNDDDADDDNSEEGEPFQYQVQFERGRPLGLSLKKDSVLGDIIVMSVEDGGMAAGKCSICPNDIIVQVDEFSVEHWSLKCLADYVKAEGPEYITMTLQVSEKALRETVESILSDIIDKAELRGMVKSTPSDDVDSADMKTLPLYPSVARFALVKKEKTDAVQNLLVDGPAKSAIAVVDEDEKDKDDGIVATTFDLRHHRGPFAKLRQGTSYHLLPIDDKLQILEFLLDELLSAGPEIVEELERRSAACDTFLQSGSGGRPAGAAYGCPPDADGLGAVDNNNVCAICNEEGDLLCCDGCVSSYHKRCLCLKTALPQGKWLCPECEISDPSLLGPITSGKKESLDWFSLSSLGMELSRKLDKAVRTALSTVEFLVLHGFVFARDIISKDPVGIDQILSGQGDKNRVEDAANAPSSAISLLDSFRGPRHPLPLTQEHVFRLLHCFGPEICAQWPWSQIPFDCQKVWSLEELLPPSTLQGEEAILKEGQDESLASATAGESVDTGTLSTMGHRTRSAEEKRVAANVTYTKLLAHQQNYRQYFLQSSSYNPLSYTNQYRYIFAGAKSESGHSHIATHHHFDKENFYQPSIQLYNALSRDFSIDDALVQVLRKHPSLLDPLQLVRNYVIGLEHTLLRSSLLSSLWGAVKKTYSKEAWRMNVEKCRTVQGLARLLVDLVDAANSRAFVEDWEILPKGKGSDHTDSSEKREDVFRMYFSLTEDWTAGREITRRKWERSEVSDVLSLLHCESDGSSAAIFKHQHQHQHQQEEGVGDLRSATARKRKSTAPRAIRDDVEIEESMEQSDIALSNAHLSEGTEGVSPIPSNAPETHSSTAQGDLYPPPKKNLPAYRHFCIATMANLKASGDKRSFGAQNKYCSKLWKEISPKEKAKYQKIAADDKARYQKEATERDAAMRSELSTHDAEENKESSQESTAQTEEAASAGDDHPLSSPPRLASSRDHRRRSGRVQRQKAVHKEIGSIVGSPAGTNRTTLEVRDIGHGKLLAKGEQQSLMNEAKEKKIAELEQLVQHPFERDPMWPLAGRKLFDPEGSLPRSVARCVGRVGGSRKIPNVSYDEQFEVGRPSVSNIWRKKTLECNSIETLAMQIQILDSYLDKEVIRSCEHLARRSSSVKQNAPKAVVCTHRDVETGRMEYFVVQRAKRRGCWFDERDIDLPSLITWLSDRFEAQQIKAGEVAEKARKEAEAEKVALAAARRAKKRARAKAKAKAEEAAKTADDAAERPRKKSKTTEISADEGMRQKVRQGNAQNQQAELAFQPRSKLESPSRPEESKNPQDVGIPKTVVTANPSSLSKELVPEASKMQTSSHRQGEKKVKEEKEKKKRKKKKSSTRSDASSHHQFSASEARNILNAMPRSEGIENCKKFLKHITSSHRKDTYRLLREASKKGKAMVPEETLNNMRVRRLTEMKNINNELEKLGAPTYDQVALTQKLVEAEHGATKDFVKGASRRKRSGGVGSTSSSKRRRKSGEKYRDSALPRDVVIKSTPSPHHHAIGPSIAQGAATNSYSGAMGPGMNVDNQAAPAGFGAGFGAMENLYNNAMSPEMSINTSSGMQTAPTAGTAINAGLQNQFGMPGGGLIGDGSQTTGTAHSVPVQETTQGVSTGQSIGDTFAPSLMMQAQSLPAQGMQLHDLQRLLSQQQSQLQGMLTTNTNSQPTGQGQSNDSQYQQLFGGLFGQNSTGESSSMPPPPHQQQQQQQQQSTSSGDGDDTDGFNTDSFMQGWGEAFEPTPMRPK